MAQYKDLYPRAYKCYLLVDNPDKVKKFLVGRQFFVIFVVILLPLLPPTAQSNLILSNPIPSHLTR